MKMSEVLVVAVDDCNWSFPKALTDFKKIRVLTTKKKMYLKSQYSSTQ